MPTYTLAVTVNDYEIHPQNLTTRTRILAHKEEHEYINAVYVIILSYEEFGLR